MKCLVSVYAPHIRRLVEYKRGLGYKFDHGESVLSQFDAFCAQRGEQRVGVSQELAEAWGRKRANESDPTRYGRVHYLIQLASFLNDIGYPSYVPRPPAKYSSTFTPRILSHGEVSDLLAAVDSVCSEARRMPSSCGPAAPYVIRFLYGTGARIGEAVRMRGSDVDLGRGTALLRWTKNGQERIVPMSPSLTACMAEYAEVCPVGIDPDEPFFRRRDYRPCSEDAIYEWFRKGLARAGIPHGGKGAGPRLHDLRHSFSVHALAKMADEGLDLYYSLPILSTYLGHQSLEATDAYVRLTAEMYPAITEASNAVCPYAFKRLG